MDISATTVVLTVMLMFIVGCVKAAHLPPSAIEGDQTYHHDTNENDNRGHTNNNPMELLQDLASRSETKNGQSAKEDENLPETVILNEAPQTNPYKEEEELAKKQQEMEAILQKMKQEAKVEQMKKEAIQQQGTEVTKQKSTEATKKDELDSTKMQELEVMLHEQFMIQEQMKQQEERLEQMKQEAMQRQLLQERMRQAQQKQLQEEEELRQAMMKPQEHLRQQQHLTYPTDGSEQRLSKQELVGLFSSSMRASVTMFPGCPFNHFILRARCWGNIVEVTVSTRAPAIGQLSVVGGRGQVIIDGAYQLMYVVMLREWKLTKELVKSDLEPNCPSCQHLKPQILLQVGEVTCGAEVECRRSDIDDFNHIPVAIPAPPNVTPPPPSSHHVPSPYQLPQQQYPQHQPPLRAAPVPASNTPLNLASLRESQKDPTLNARSTLTIYHGDGGDDSGEEVKTPVTLGAKVSLVVSVSTSDLPLDLHVIKCEVRDEGSRSVTIVKDGCSSSQVMGEFKEVVTSSEDGNEAGSEEGVRRVVTQRAHLQIFNTRASPQNITIVCFVKMCSMECPEKPSCVQSDINIGKKSKRPSWSLFSRQVTLSTTIPVLGFIHKPAASDSEKVIATGGGVDGEAFNIHQSQNCVSYRTVYVMLSLLTGVYLIFLVLAILCSHHVTAKVVTGGSGGGMKKKYFDDDSESPTRALYQEYNSPRKRTTPKSSPEHSVYMNTATSPHRY
ncbi:hypothetical protein Pmani_000658 [Petrolisthes manimaculis]|uniref:ZP domain-containing protein n=1 Tax=Petrolisthes manimaculis TaxID=1843537 RepID=A0AAE1QLJ5_9EUCA|nr:hypothetical protein Pmani_000658 [Petrolisthes manimaculis]